MPYNNSMLEFQNEVPGTLTTMFRDQILELWNNTGSGQFEVIHSACLSAGNTEDQFNFNFVDDNPSNVISRMTQLMGGIPFDNYSGTSTVIVKFNR